MDRHRFYMALLKRLVWEDPVTLACALAVRVWDGKRSQDMLLEKINQGGLEMLYEILLDTSGPELCKALQVLTGGVI